MIRNNILEPLPVRSTMGNLAGTWDSISGMTSVTGGIGNIETPTIMPSHQDVCTSVDKTLDSKYSNLIAIVHNICIIFDSRITVIHYAARVALADLRTLSCLVRVDMRATGLNCQNLSQGLQ